MIAALWQRSIDLEHPAGSGNFEQAKPVGFIMGGIGDMVEDLDRWFGSPDLVFWKEISGVDPDGTRVFFYRGKSTLWRVSYRIMADTVSAGGLRDIPMNEDPIYTERKGWGADF